MQFVYLDGTPYAQFDYRNGLYYMDDVDKQHRSSLSLAHKDTLRIYAHKSTQRFIACVCVMYDMVWVWTINEGMVHSRDISSSAMLPASVLPSSSHKVANSHHLLGTRTIHQQTTTKKETLSDRRDKHLSTLHFHLYTMQIVLFFFCCLCFFINIVRASRIHHIHVARCDCFTYTHTGIEVNERLTCAYLIPTLVCRIRSVSSSVVYEKNVFLFLFFFKF